MAKKNKPKRVHKQTQIPGTEKSGVPEVEDAADEVREARAEVKAATKARDVKVAALISAMKAHGVKEYKFDDGDDDVIVNHLTVDKVSIRTKSKAPPKGASTGAN